MAPAVRTPIVVGYDGSDHADAALRWALDEARLRGAPVRVVHAWQVPFVEGYPAGGALFDPAALEATARQLLADGVAAAVEATGAGPDDPVVEQVVAAGSPASTVLEHAEDAQLVVVGSRGIGGFRELLLGSVSDQVTRHATCPVVVVRAHPDRR